MLINDIDKSLKKGPVIKKKESMKKEQQADYKKLIFL